MSQITKPPASTELAVKNDPPFKKLLDSKLDAIRAVASKALDPVTLIKLVGLCAMRTPRLAQCTPLSVTTAVMTCAEIGLYPSNTFGTAYLVPYYNGKAKCYECQLIVGYRGLCTLARRSGEIITIDAQVVREGDEFEIEYGIDPIFRHKPKGDVSKPVIAVWALARLKGGGHQLTVMSPEEIEAIRNRSQAGDKGPWVTDWVEMAKKTAIRRLCKLLPLTPEVEQVISVADNSSFNFDIPEIPDDEGPAREGDDEPKQPADTKPAGDALADKLNKGKKGKQPEPEPQPIPKTNGPMPAGDIDGAMGN